MKIDPHLSPCTKLRSKWIKDININPTTLNLIEEKVGSSLQDIGTGDQFLRKLGVNLPQDSAIPLLGIYPRDALSHHKSICSTMFIAALFVIARTWKQPRCPSIEEWLKKVWNIRVLHSGKKQWYLEFCMQMDGHRKRFTEWGKPDPKRGLWYVFTHMWILAIIKGLWAFYSWS